MDNFRVGAGTEDPHLEGRAAPEFVLNGHQSHVSIDVIILSFCPLRLLQAFCSFHFCERSPKSGCPNLKWPRAMDWVGMMERYL